MLDAGVMFEELSIALESPTDKDGNIYLDMPMLEAFCESYIAQLKGTQVLSPLTGIGIPANAPTPNATEFIGGSSFGGRILQLQSPPIGNAMINAAKSDLNALARINIQKFAKTVTTYVLGAAQVIFDAGSVTGKCTALQPIGTFPGAPGILAGGKAEGGYVIGLVGAALYGLIKSEFNFSVELPYLQKFSTVVCDYTMDNMEIEHPPGMVIGTFGIGGGPVAGQATPGVIS